MNVNNFFLVTFLTSLWQTEQNQFKFALFLVKPEQEKCYQSKQQSHIMLRTFPIIFLQVPQRQFFRPVALATICISSRKAFSSQNSLILFKQNKESRTESENSFPNFKSVFVTTNSPFTAPFALSISHVTHDNMEIFCDFLPISLNGTLIKKMKTSIFIERGKRKYKKCQASSILYYLMDNLSSWDQLVVCLLICLRLLLENIYSISI